MYLCILIQCVFLFCLLICICSCIHDRSSKLTIRFGRLSFNIAYLTITFFVCVGPKRTDLLLMQMCAWNFHAKFVFHRGLQCKVYMCPWMSMTFSTFVQNLYSQHTALSTANLAVVFFGLPPFLITFRSVPFRSFQWIWFLFGFYIPSNWYLDKRHQTKWWCVSRWLFNQKSRLFEVLPFFPSISNIRCSPIQTYLHFGLTKRNSPATSC